MNIIQLAKQATQFSVNERIKLVDFILKSIWQETKPALKMSEAAKMLLWDYENDDELTTFTN